MAKLLSIVWYKVLPAKYGGQKGISGFNKYLGKNTELVCICSKNNENTSGLSYKLLPVLPVSKWQFINPFVWKKIKNRAAEEKSTHIILEHPYHALAGLMAQKSTGAKLIIHSHNIEYLRFKEQRKWWWKLLYFYEKWAHRKADLNLFKTNNDLSHAVNTFGLNKNKCIIIPYGIDHEEKKPDREKARQIICKRHRINPQEKILFFGGTLDYLSNAKAVEFIYYKIAPLLEDKQFPGKIIICGRNKLKKFQYLKKLSHTLVIQAGEVTDIENYFTAADLFINPVMTGGGVQTKNIDAAVLNTPVVCFDIAGSVSAADTFNQLVHLSKPGDPAVFVQNIYKVIDHPEYRNQGPANELYWNTIISKNLHLFTGL